MEEFARGFPNQHTTHRDTPVYSYANVQGPARRVSRRAKQRDEGEMKKKGVRRERWCTAISRSRESTSASYAAGDARGYFVCVYLYTYLYADGAVCKARARAHVRADGRTCACVRTYVHVCVHACMHR